MRDSSGLDVYSSFVPAVPLEGTPTNLKRILPVMDGLEPTRPWRCNMQHVEAFVGGACGFDTELRAFAFEVCVKSMGRLARIEPLLDQ